jgi:hypothetical protein
MRLIAVITFLFVLGVSNQVFAAPTVFLKDGTKEVGTTVWVDGNSIYLSKSREVYEFSSEELNLEETLKFNRLGNYADKALPDSRVPVHREAPVKKSPTGEPVAGNSSTADTTPGERPFFGVQLPDDSTPCPSGLQAELTARFAKYNQAAVAGDFREFEKHIIEYQAEGSRKALAGLSKKELQERRKLLQGLSSQNYRPSACLVSPRGDLAAVAGRAIHDGNGNAHGSFLFRKEGQAWKVQSSVWNMSM